MLWGGLMLFYECRVIVATFVLTSRVATGLCRANELTGPEALSLFGMPKVLAEAKGKLREPIA
jgi:hypothetical protein